MIEPLLVTLLPFLFTILLFGGGEVFRRKKIDQDGVPPIARGRYHASKYSILVLWAAMVCQTWGLDLSLFTMPRLLKVVSLFLWAFGFALLFSGRLGLGDSFRIGSAKENTSLRTGGLFRWSRNPMYVGVFATLIASVLYTRNPILLLLAAFVIVVHHQIVRAEEQHLTGVFGQEYLVYCSRVRRYL